MHKMHEDSLVANGVGGGGDGTTAAGTATILNIGSRAISGNDMNGNGLAITILTPVSSSTSNGSSQILVASRPQNGHHHLQQQPNNMFSISTIENGTTTIIAHSNHHNNNNTINGASSTTPNNGQAIGNAGMLISSNNSNTNNNHCNVITTTSSQQQHHQQCSTSNVIGMSTVIEGATTVTATTSNTGNLHLSTAVIAAVDDANGTGEKIALLSVADQSYSSAESLEIDIGDAAFDENSEGR